MIECYIMDTDKNMNVGKHFKVREFACRDNSQVVFIDTHLVTIVTGKQIGRASCRERV